MYVGKNVGAGGIGIGSDPLCAETERSKPDVRPGSGPSSATNLLTRWLPASPWSPPLNSSTVK